MLRYGFTLIFLLLPLSASGIVFRCETKTGKISYQQLPCTDTQGSQTVLAIAATSNNARSGVLPPISPVDNHDQRVEKIKPKGQKKPRRQRKTAEEIKKIAQEKAFKRELRCNNVQLKIQLLHNRLRAGYTARQELRINEQLLHYARLQEKYCS